MQENKQSPGVQGELPQDVAGEGLDDTQQHNEQGQATPTQRDTIPGLEESLRQAELKAAEHHDAWLRARAETENVRRRAQEEIAKASKFAAEKFASSILPVKDSLEAALSSPNQTIESLREGVELTLKQLVSAFHDAEIVEENPAGEKFDPNKHDAIGTLESDGEPNIVLNVLQKGYLLHERVLRPAMVMVSKPAEPRGSRGE